FTIDTTGNVLAPVDWSRVLVRKNDVPVPRLLHADLPLESFAGSGLPILLADDGPLGSFSLHGQPLPPVCTPRVDLSLQPNLPLFGSADAPATVLRIARGRTCTGGAAAGLPCREDAGCPDATCGGGLFDFSTRLTDGTGPIVLRRGACLGGSRAGLSCNGA